ncbi:ATP-binding protein [Parafrankia sp. BMG5.11]|uniref:ATP-binding protein n=1 Tax=Parafrankia sp. BMG5.11 TaxID=222540 RepID=UPI00103E05C6|nr:ATP-binding protein [Parafrankia sp. BMG5.11]TCJ34592.1 DNA mismatch repair protein [Parafrankia sp. BMG5.11]
MVEIFLEVGEAKILQFARRKSISAIAELIWNALDANATKVSVEFERSPLGAIESLLVRDDGEGISPRTAEESFKTYGDTWKSGRGHTANNQRILHGSHGEGRLFAFALGDNIVWDSVAEVDGNKFRTRISVDRAKPTVWSVSPPAETTAETGTTVRISVPQGKKLGALEASSARTKLTALLAFYLRAYPDVSIEYDGRLLDPDALISDVVNVSLDLPEEYQSDPVVPVVSIVEWKERTPSQKMLLCDSAGIALAEYGQEWSDPIVYFTPYLRSPRFKKLTSDELHMLQMDHSALLHAADKAIRSYVRERQQEISGQIVRELREEGIYPYDDGDTGPTRLVERQTFDLVVTVARTALPPKGAPRKLSVRLLQSALENEPSGLREILDQVLNITDEEREHLSKLLAQTELSSVISAATTVTNRLNFIGGLRKILSDKELRLKLREVDQLHPMVAQNLWLFGEEWDLARTEVGLTSVLESHLHLLGGDTALEGKLDRVVRDDGRAGRVDILLYRGIGGENYSERLVVELKRPSIKVGRKELEQVRDYASAIVDDPQFRGVDVKWKFILVTYDTHPEIKRSIRQHGRPPGLADNQEEYEVWVKTWGEIFHTAEKKLSFFRDQLSYEATEERVTQYLRESYSKYIPEDIRDDLLRRAPGERLRIA